MQQDAEMHRVAYALYSAELLLVSCRPLSSLGSSRLPPWLSIRFGTTVLGHAIGPTIIHAAGWCESTGCLRSQHCCISCRPLSSLSVLLDYRSWSSIRFGTTFLGCAIGPAIIYAAGRREAMGCLSSLHSRLGLDMRHTSALPFLVML